MRDGSGSRHYRYLMEDTDRHGNVRVYYRKLGRKIRLHEKPGTEAFDREYRLAFNGKTLPITPGRVSVPGTFRWLCEQYYSSAVFKTLDIRTRKVRRSILEQIAERLATRPFAMMRPQDVAKLRDEKAETPAAANQLVQAVRSLFAWASDPEYALARDNPAVKTKFLTLRNPDGFKAWTEDDVNRYCEFYATGTKERLAIDLLLLTGCRRSDVIQLGPQMERDGHLVFTEFKGRRRTPKQHRMPILPALRASIDATPATGQLAYLVNRYGQPFKPETFSKWFGARCKTAGIEAGLSAHGLRKFAAQWCAENGATEDQIMALFGWLSRDMVSRYVRGANRDKLESVASRILGERK